MSIHPSRLPEMAANVRRYCKAKGWDDEEVSFATAMALLHEEAAEAGHAWRVWGLEDATAGSGSKPGGHWLAKPEGVGSEFADILIRWLDDEIRYSMGGIEYLDSYEGAFALADHFMDNINALHGQIARVTMARDTCYESPVGEFAGVLAFLFQLCDLYGIDLHAEYTRKMDYNWTREHRHGGRRA